MKPRRIVWTLAIPFLVPVAVEAQTAAPEDVATPDAIVDALYATIQRRPGENFQLERMRTLHHPDARLLPNSEQTEGTSRAMSADEFIVWASSFTVVGGEGDRGFVEEEIAREVVRYGDVAHVWSAYQAHFWADSQILERGVNSIQLVFADGRWWIFSAVWDEESAAGPIPEELIADD